MPDPEQLARQEIDPLLGPCGWQVQDKSRPSILPSQRGVAVRELSFKTGEPDYTLFVDGKAIGTMEAKPAGHSLTGVEEQSEKYVKGVPFGIPAWRSPLPFCYESTGTETRLRQPSRSRAAQPQRIRVSPTGNFARMGGKPRSAPSCRNDRRIRQPQRQPPKPHPAHAAADR